MNAPWLQQNISEIDGIEIKNKNEVLSVRMKLQFVKNRITSE